MLPSARATRRAPVTGNVRPMRNTAVALCLLFLPPSAMAQTGTWTPKLDFKLEDSTYSETLAWISGHAYALTEVGRRASKAARAPFCLSKAAHVDSRVLLDALNAKFSGKRISAEEAAPVLYDATVSHYGCRK